MIESATWSASLDLYKSRFLEVGNFSPTTRAGYLAILKDLKAYVTTELGIGSLDEIAGYHLRKYLDSFDFEDSSKSRAARRVSAICSFFGFLVRQGVIEADPAFDLRKRRTNHSPSPLVFDDDDWPEPPNVEETKDTRELSETLAHGPDGAVTAHQIKSYLDTKVVGQERAKTQISVLLSMHMNWFGREERMHRSPNAIILGPTGVGKTHSLRVASEYLQIPFVSVDTTSLVPSGIMGLQIEDVLGDLVREAGEILQRKGCLRHPNDDVELARRGIIFFDEFDKINTASGSNYNSSSNLSVQRRLLKLTDGAVLGTAVRGHGVSTATPVSIDTSGILIFTGGAFAGIEDNKIRTLRDAELQRELSKTNPNVIVSEDIVNYGFMQELIARLPVLVEFEALTHEDLVKILDIPDVSPTQVWIAHFCQLGKELVIGEDAKDHAVRKAQVLKMGARGLHQVFFPALANLAFEIEASSDPRFVVTANTLIKASEQTKGAKHYAH